MEFANQLRRVSASMRYPSCDEENHQAEKLEQQLDQFWGHDSLSGRFSQERERFSLEREFSSGDFLSLPSVPTVTQDKKVTVRHEAGCVVRGEEIGDIPTNYTINGLKSSEIPVIGTYVDRRIVPGFRYRVRLNQSEKFLFQGQPLHLQSVGGGYGKRLTFRSTCKNENDNYFWSDTNPDGYGFKPIALWQGDQITLTQGNEVTSEVQVIACVSQTEVSTDVTQDGAVEKRFQVKFLCRPVGVDEGEDRASLVVASAVLKKVKGQRWAKVDKVLLATKCSVRASSFVRQLA